MGNDSSIEWTDATWNPVRGCTKISPGCKHCYAETFSERFRGVPGHPFEQGFDLRLVTEKLDAPLRWRAPRKVFVNSMSDLFHEDVPDEYIAAVFGVMAACPQHTFQVLTKRPERMRAWFEWIAKGSSDVNAKIRSVQAYTCDALRRAGVETGCGSAFDPEEWPLPNVWLGVSVESQKYADERIPHLLACPAAVRFLSCEPLLEAVDLDEWIERIDHCDTCREESPPQRSDRCPACGDEGTLISTWGHEQAERYRTGERYDPESAAGQRDMEEGPGLHWVIVGGESGPKSRPLDLAWPRSIVAQCKAAGVPVFVKQLGAYPLIDIRYDRTLPGARRLVSRKGNDPAEWPADLNVREWPAK